MGKARSTSAPSKQENVVTEFRPPATAHSPAVTYFSMAFFLMLCPPFVIALWFTMAESDGSFITTVIFFGENGINGLYSIWPRPSLSAAKLILTFGFFEALLQVFLPGEHYHGPLSPTGHRPLYKKNGFTAFLVTLTLYYIIWRENIFNPSVVYDRLGEMFSTLIFGSLLFCMTLFIKGHVAPSSTDGGSSGNFLVDFYWGMELYPRIGKWFDIKQFTNCRFGMMSWGVLVLTYCIKQETFVWALGSVCPDIAAGLCSLVIIAICQLTFTLNGLSGMYGISDKACTQVELYGKLSDSLLVSSILMLVYIAKFFWWEPGYMSSMDIAHDRAGFYIVWGCLVWVPCIYTSPALYLVKNPIELHFPAAFAITLAGLICIYINYECDYQRLLFRQTGGKAKIWGQVPSKIIAHYSTETGDQKQSILLTSGWWGVARHFHYVPEILASFFWSLPALFYNFSPYFYTVYLTLLLFDRATRDDQRCRAKYVKKCVRHCLASFLGLVGYQKYWEQYCTKVRYAIVPGVY